MPDKTAAVLSRMWPGRGMVGGMEGRPPLLPTVIASRNRNSNFVLGLLHGLPAGRFGHVFVDGLRDFGVPMLFGIEPRVYLIAKIAADLSIGGRQHNDNPLMTGPLDAAERTRRIKIYLRSRGHRFED